MAEGFKVKLSEDVEPQTKQQEEAQVLEQAAEAGEIAPESAGISEDGVHKINLDKPIEDAVQERETEKVDVGEQARDGEEVDRRVREQPSQEDDGQETETRSHESPIEYIQDETSDGNDEAAPSGGQPQPDNAASEEGSGTESEPVQPELPDGLDKLVKFMKETGGTLEDYVHLNRDIDNMQGVDLLKEHYKQKYPELDESEINFMLDEEFAYDQDTDSEREIKKKQIAYKKAVGEARGTLKQMRDKFYQDLKFSRGSDLTDEQKEAIMAYEKQQEAAKANQAVLDDYNKKTSKYFNDFKGFELKLNDKKVRYRVADINKTKSLQENPSEWMNSYTDEKGYLKDPAEWHKALYAAKNIDKIAQHFYDQGRADAVTEGAKKAKNIDMEPRQNHGEVEVGGQKIRVVSGDDSSKLRFRIGKYR